MNFDSLKQAFADPRAVSETAREARTIALQAREDSRALVQRMNQQVQLDVAKSVGATVEIGNPSHAAEASRPAAQ